MFVEHIRFPSPSSNVVCTMHIDRISMSWLKRQTIRKNPLRLVILWHFRVFHKNALKFPLNNYGIRKHAALDICLFRSIAPCSQWSLVNSMSVCARVCVCVCLMNLETILLPFIASIQMWMALQIVGIVSPFSIHNRGLFLQCTEIFYFPCFQMMHFWTIYAINVINNKLKLFHFTAIIPFDVIVEWIHETFNIFYRFSSDFLFRLHLVRLLLLPLLRSSACSCLAFQIIIANGIFFL